MPLRLPLATHLFWVSHIHWLCRDARQSKTWGLQDDYSGVLISKNKKRKSFQIKEAQIIGGRNHTGGSRQQGHTVLWNRTQGFSWMACRCSQCDLYALLLTAPSSPALPTIILAYIKNDSRAGVVRTQELTLLCLLVHLCWDLWLLLGYVCWFQVTYYNQWSLGCLGIVYFSVILSTPIYQKFPSFS